MARLDQQSPHPLEFAYERETLIFQMTLKRIDDAMRDRFPPPGDEAHPATWAHVGDLQHINGLLGQIRDQLEGKN
jgi:hypothetical protein